MNARAEEMERQGEVDCPDWCEQPDDEEQSQQHISTPEEYRTGDNDVIQVRARLGWGGDGDDQIQVIITPGDGSNEIWLRLGDKEQIAGMLDAAEELLTTGYTPKEAYPGAWDEDEEDDDEEDWEEG